MRSASVPAASLLSALFVASLSAQAPNNLIGVTRNIPLILQHDQNACAPLPSCPSVLPSAALLPPYVGGTAWDPQRSHVWVTTGVLLEAHDMRTCTNVCPPVPCPVSAPGAFATGLAFTESTNRLWVIDSFGAILQCANGCPPTPVAVCNTGLAPGPNAATTGLAVDEGKGLVFYSYADFTTGASRLFVSTTANPCVPFHIQPITGCGTVSFGPVTGLAVDWCQNILYITNGRQTQGWRYVVTVTPLSIAFLPINCCTMAFNPDQMIGLDVRPGGATQTGASCANGACPPCPMTHTLRNDPNIGNLAFALGLDNAPTGGLAWCVIGGGPCGPGLLVPGLCGPIHTPTILGNIGPAILGGVGACGGSATFPLGLPMIPGLCGAVLSSQCITLCPATGGGFGVAMSPCLSFALQGS